jgi:uncharacterized protein with FMN-binding domain
MRRVIFAIVGTIAGLAALLSFKSHEPATVAATSGATGATGATGAAGTTGATGAATATGKPPAGERDIDGNVANTVYGPVQVQVVVKDSKIVDVKILEQPSSTANDLQIGQFAFPQLIKETLAAQSAHVDSVSGATYTSGGYVQSLQSALDNGA